MGTEKAARPPYVLWLIRDGKATTLTELYEHFGEELAQIDPSEQSYVDYSLDRLEEAGLIIREEGKLRVTPLVRKIQTTLGISITTLAHNPPDKTLVAAPVFGVPNDAKHAYDLFVLMPFKPELQPVYTGHIKKVAQRLNLKIEKADNFFTVGSVMEQVWSAIVQSKIIIADCTDKNPNVFYEIGIAHTLGKPVILMTQSEEDIPFDLRHHRYIKYEYTPPGMKVFEKQLKETIHDLRKE